jgi:hypothetical protein
MYLNRIHDQIRIVTNGMDTNTCTIYLFRQISDEYGYYLVRYRVLVGKYALIA